MRCLYDIAGHNRRGNSGELVAKIKNSPEGADTFSRSNQRGNRPSYRRGGGQSSDRNADPEKRGGRTVRAGSAENSQAADRPADENNLTNTNRVPAALYQRIDEPPAYDKIGERREQPGNTGIQRRMKQVDMMHGGKIRRQPGQEEIESVVIRREAQSQAANFSLSKQIAERRSLGRPRPVFRLRSSAFDEFSLGVRQ